MGNAAGDRRPARGADLEGKVLGAGDQCFFPLRTVASGLQSLLAVEVGQPDGTSDRIRQVLLFILCAAFFSSSCQLAVSDSAGIGFSGVGYGIFGFMWIARRRYPGFREVLDQRIAMFFMVWLVGCAVATRLNLVHVANMAHFSGLLFGAAVAGCLVARARPHRWLIAAGLATLCLGAVVLLFWNPWNVAWLSMKAYDAHLSGHYAEALQRYDRILAIDPGNGWAASNRALCVTSLH